MKIEIKENITRNVYFQDEPLLIHKKGTIEFEEPILFIVGQNGSGKSTFAEWLEKEYKFDLYGKEEDIEKSSGTEQILNHFSSSGEKTINNLSNFINNNNTEWLIMDEPEKSISLHGQVGLAHLFKDKIGEGKKMIIISHSYILLYFAEKNNLPIYDFDKKKIVKNYLPNL